MIKLENINLSFDEFELKDINFQVEAGEYYVVLGLSGAGKSLLLECISGIQKPDSGKIILDNVDITKQKIQARNVGYVFQHHAIFPHLNVFQNIAYPIKKQFPKQLVKKKVEKIADIVNITHLLKRDTKTLSGGESQRVALARTLIRNPKCILLDEPFSSLDVQLRDNLRALLHKINQLGQTIIHVTHDYEEAVTLAHKIAIFQNGEIIQDGKPSDVFNNPKSAFVARFKGIRNFFAVKMISENIVKYNNSIKIEIPPRTEIDKGNILIKSQDLKISKKENNIKSSNKFKGIIKDIIPSQKGNEIVIDADIKLTAFISHDLFNKLDLKIKENVWVHFKITSVKFIESLYE
jgi:ABC-type sugar transport system ATPase subunit